MKNTHIIILFFMISIGISSCITSKKEVDLILYNAKVYTVDSAFSIQECVVIDSGYILETGQQDVLLKKYNTKKSIDLKGKYVYPGFIDAHCHFFGYAIDQLEADVADTKSFDEVIETLQNFSKNNKNKWIVGRGWDQNDWEVKEFPNKRKLDSVFKDIPVFLTRVDGHAALVNSKALEIAGITKDTKIEGGKIYLHNNEPSGILIDNAIELVSKHIPKTSVEDSKIALITAAEKCFAVGLTSVGDAGLDKEMVLLIDSLHKKGELKMKIYAMLNPTTENLETFMNKGTYKTPYLNIRSVKLFADGALGSRGACLIEPYSDDTDNYGIIINKE
ncbi:MAG TPA: amidohydrolase family protein, partial [Bacteroidales bacterium]|nr:amidohydrolase family protein [Bacteroidales bacterium]